MPSSSHFLEASVHGEGGTPCNPSADSDEFLRGAQFYPDMLRRQRRTATLTNRVLGSDDLTRRPCPVSARTHIAGVLRLFPLLQRRWSRVRGGAVPPHAS
jgi:hypothetical protein